MKTLAVLALCLMTCTAMAQNADQNSPCTSPEHRQFDFWIGEWNVTQNDKPAGTSRITTILGGCVLMEEWQSANSAYGGKSFNRYDPTKGKWEQFWVDSGGGVLRLTGGYGDNKMILQGATQKPDGTVLQKITWHNNDDGTVRQVWEQSKDGGSTWKAVFDGLYERKQ